MLPVFCLRHNAVEKRRTLGGCDQVFSHLEAVRLAAAVPASGTVREITAQR